MVEEKEVVSLAFDLPQSVLITLYTRGTLSGNAGMEKAPRWRLSLSAPAGSAAGKPGSRVS